MYGPDQMRPKRVETRDAETEPTVSLSSGHMPASHGCRSTRLGSMRIAATVGQTRDGRQSF